MKIAISANKKGLVFEGHFAHAEIFKIYEYKDGKLKEIETRDNPLGLVPDVDYQAENECCMHGAHEDIGVQLHGVEKYAYLRNNVLNDVDVIIAGGACQTSYAYFTSQGVRILFAQIVPVRDVERFIREDPKSFEELLSSTT